jgi:hypothetical protein
MPFLKLTKRVVLLGVLTLVALKTPTAFAATSCPLVQIRPPARWISSALWSSSKGVILAVDSNAKPAGRLVTLTPQGALTVKPEFGVNALPVLLGQTNQRTILKMLGRESVTLREEDWSAAAPADFLKKAVAQEGRVGSIYQWIGLGDSMLAFGSVRSKSFPDGYELGLMRIPVAAPEETRLLDAPVKGDMYLLGPPYQYVAALGDKGVFLRMESGARAEFFEVLPGASHAMPLVVRGIPDEFLQVPADFNGVISGPDQAPDLYKRVEKLTIAAGIYGSADGKQLFLLARRPMGQGETEWRLFRVDPALGKVVGEVVLPSTAPEIIPVFSPQTLFLIERRGLKPSGEAEINRMFEIPMSQVETAGMGGAALCK